MSYTTDYYVFAATGDSLLGADADKETVELARRLLMLEHDEEDSCIGKVNFVHKEEKHDDFFDTAMPTVNSWQFSINDIFEDAGASVWQVEIYIEEGGVTPDNVVAVLPAMWRHRHRSFDTPTEAIEHLVLVEKNREGFNSRTPEACRNALAIYARRSKWWAGCLPSGEDNAEHVQALMKPVQATVKFFRAAEREGNETKMALFTTLVADGYTLSEALEATTAALAD